MSNQEKFEEYNRNILDCMTGADGGVKYMKYLNAMRQLSKRADNGDDAARQIVVMVERFSMLLDIL